MHAGLLKMHWSPEHAQSLSQWPEQHLDVSSTTSPPAYKPELSSTERRCYAWANDDISALTASSLLRHYAEKYSGVLDSPPASAYTESGASGSLGGSKSEPEAWPLTHGAEGYPGLDGVGGAKTTVVMSAVPPCTGSMLVVDGNLSDPGYSTGGSCEGPLSQDYPAAYNSTYLTPRYCPSPSAFPTPSQHALQPASTLVSSCTPPGPIYNYPPSSYSHQLGLAPTCTHSPAPYLSSALATPTPLPVHPTFAGGSYGYENHNLGGTEPQESLKRKALDKTEVNNEGGGSRYGKHGFNHPKPEGGSPYSVGDTAECPVNGFGTGSANSQTYKHRKLPSQPGLGSNEEGKYSGVKPLVSPPYASVGEYSPHAALNGDRGEDHGFPQPHFAPRLLVAFSESEELLKSTDPQLLELVTTDLQDRRPPLPWGELAGHARIKAALEEDVLRPALRPSPASLLPRTVLLFGPRRAGKTTLAHCLASQLGATFFRLSGAALAPKWEGEGGKILRTLFLVAGARQPSVVLISEVEALMADGPRQQVLAHLDAAQQGAAAQLVVCTTHRPDMLGDAAHCRFAKSYYMGLPDMRARRQVLLRALAPQNSFLSEGELGALLQCTEGLSVSQLLQLCQQATASASASVPTPLHSLPAPLIGPAFKDFEKALSKVQALTTSKELDACIKWSKAYRK
ncbi:fidgetin-like protein 2 [Megalops cyprinoides]|uniref:fidgetin-like protein 2 n=1 Tax=Megalops cyprinoides TaxID=118141 RepID=UPI001864D8DD|nr:fidgetin-like protein 2 [Megalops cyprinoides]